IAFTPDGSRAYVTNRENGTVLTIDTDPTSPTVNTVTSTIPVGESPGAVAITTDGKHAYVTNEHGRSVSVIKIEQTPTVTGTPPTGVLGQSYGYDFTVAGQPRPVNVTATGPLPDGLTLTKAGVLTGTPTKAGTFNFTVIASNSIGESAPLAVTIEITDTTLPSTGSLGFLGAIFGS
ncbi:YncE family protein, partial [Rhodococcus sp. ARC_M6]|uniref:YncE family protein n=1 Tax=Rhodococcus sp. ARC_M6 TaxID=2928852 RepID=UPI001FB48C16